MANKKFFAGMLAMALALGMVLVGCATETKTVTATEIATKIEIEPEWTLKEILRKYMGPSPQTWEHDGEQDEQDTVVYFLDTLHFEDFRAELDAGGEYPQVDNGTEDRNWEQGKNFARWAERPDGTFALNHCKSDNSVIWYNYTKAPEASGLKLKEILRKYMGPSPQTWEHDGVPDAQDTVVYFLAPPHFEDFRAELDAGGKYFQFDERTYTRNWEQGKTFASWAERPDGTFELSLCKSDNSIIEYEYKKAP